MKNYQKNNIYICLLVTLLTSTSMWSCKKFVTLPLPNTQIPADAIFNDPTTLTAALNGVYSSFTSPSAAFTSPSELSDELTSTISPNDIAATTSTYTASNDYGFFSGYYSPIYKANSILAGIDQATAVPLATRNQIKGECLFLRAFCYFQLVNYYGNVPLYTGTDVTKNALLPSSPVTEVYQQIIADLSAAVPLLDDNYVIPTYATPPSPIPVRTRVNKQTANALLARTYLYTKDYADAITAATTVINSPLYNLTTDVNSIFISTSNETIWQFWNQNGFALAASGYVPSTTSNPFTYTVRPGLVSSFEPGDTRKAAFVQAGTGAQSTSYYAYKWRAKSAVAGKLEYLIEFRLAEMYLIRAEAYAQSNKIPEGVADVFTIRKRAGLLTPPATTTQSGLLVLVASERQKELCFENGHRWFDLNRTSQALTVLTPLKPGFDSHYLLLPIPRATVNINPNLVQNPGY